MIILSDYYFIVLLHVLLNLVRHTLFYLLLISIMVILPFYLYETENLACFLWTLVGTTKNVTDYRFSSFYGQVCRHVYPFQRKLVEGRVKGLLDNSRIRQLADYQLAEWSTRVLDKSRTGQLADATGDFACLFFVLLAIYRDRELSSYRWK